MPGEIFSTIKSIFSFFLKIISSSQREASSGVSRTLKGATAKQKLQTRALASQVKGPLFGGLKAARNLDKQTIRVLTKKERLAHNVGTQVKKFWKSNKKRLTQIPKEIERAEQSDIAASEEKTALSDEKKMLQVEQNALQHLQADEATIENSFKQGRQHDLKPMLKKVSHVAKVIIIEVNQGAIDPNLLKKFATLEKKILTKIKEEEAIQEQVKKDEFQSLKMLKSALIREGADLRKTLSTEQDEKNKTEIKKRIKMILGQIYLIKNTLHLSEKTEVNEELLRKQSLRIYALMEGIKKITAKGQAILET